MLKDRTTERILTVYLYRGLVNLKQHYKLYINIIQYKYTYTHIFIVTLIANKEV